MSGGHTSVNHERRLSASAADFIHWTTLHCVDQDATLVTPLGLFRGSQSDNLKHIDYIPINP